MLTLSHAPKSRSSRFVWLFEEIGQPYTVTVVSIRRRDGTSQQDPASRAVTRTARSRTRPRRLDGLRVRGAGALPRRRVPDAWLRPKIGEPKRGAFVTWLPCYTGVMELALVAKALRFPTTGPIIILRPDGYIAGALTGAALQRAGRPEFAMTTTHDIAAELMYRINADIEHFGGALPERTAIAWRS